jgi:hypothetical protein
VLSARLGGVGAEAGAGASRGKQWPCGGTRATQEQEQHATVCAGASSAGSEAVHGGTKRWLVTRRAQEELWWKASARDAGTRWPYRGRS